MAELIVKGFASKELVCDTVLYSISFNTEGKTIPEAVSGLNKEVEGFLRVMEERGVPASEFEMGDISTGEMYRYDKMPCEAQRKICLSAEFDVAASNEFLRLIEKEKMNIHFDVSYYLSDITELHKELLRHAMEDSKNKAEMLAECAGKKVIGIKKVDVNSGEHKEAEQKKAKIGCRFRGKAEQSLADKLQSPTIEESEEIEVIWEIES